MLLQAPIAEAIDAAARMAEIRIAFICRSSLSPKASPNPDEREHDGESASGRSKGPSGQFQTLLAVRIAEREQSNHANPDHRTRNPQPQEATCPTPGFPLIADFVGTNLGRNRIGRAGSRLDRVGRAVLRHAAPVCSATHRHLSRWPAPTLMQVKV